MTERSEPRNEPTFEDHLRDVEAAIRRLEGGDIPLEDSIDLYADAMGHLKACHTVLDRAERRLEIVRRSVEGTGDASASAPTAVPADVDDDGVKPA
jgi:exodeoxyribonuclease VII small subunit